jgi:hypothetical protein
MTVNGIFYFMSENKVIGILLLRFEGNKKEALRSVTLLAASVSTAK